MLQAMQRQLTQRDNSIVLRTPSGDVPLHIYDTPKGARRLALTNATNACRTPNHSPDLGTQSDGSQGGEAPQLELQHAPGSAHMPLKATVPPGILADMQAIVKAKTQQQDLAPRTPAPQGNTIASRVADLQATSTAREAAAKHDAGKGDSATQTKEKREQMRKRLQMNSKPNKGKKSKTGTDDADDEDDQDFDDDEDDEDTKDEEPKACLGKGPAPMKRPAARSMKKPAARKPKAKAKPVKACLGKRPALKKRPAARSKPVKTSAPKTSDLLKFPGEGKRDAVQIGQFMIYFSPCRYRVLKKGHIVDKAFSYQAKSARKAWNDVVQYVQGQNAKLK